MVNSRLRAGLDIAATLVMLLAGLVFIWALLVRPAPSEVVESERASSRRRNPPEATRPLPVAPMPLNGISVRGSESAKVAVVQFSDFECPFCSRFALDTLPRILAAFVDTGKVQFGFRHLPLEDRHPLARKAAEAVECSGRQSRFWEMHDLLFEQPQQLDPPSLVRKAEKLSLDRERFARCLGGGMIPKIQQDVSDAQKLFITATPTFLFGRIDADRRLKITRREAGAISYDVFAAILNELLVTDAPVTAAQQP